MEAHAQSPGARISNGLVQLMAEHFGRGPNKARTFIVDRYVFCVLEDLLTRSEQTMVANGRGSLVREWRLSFQTDMAADFKAVVEQAVGRRVVTYQSQVVFDPPMGFEFFVLDAPPG
ncbi:MAG: DUF2294 domain-containing protein [Actinomycetota bacterium]|nr:DUF2294 domain-containing protein [Actinomycetota bacterium]